MNDLIVAPEQELALQVSRFEFKVRKAKMYAASTIVPAQFRLYTEKKQGNSVVVVENQAAISNCLIVCDLAERMREDELTVFQSVDIIDSKPVWKSEFVAAKINSCGKFSADIDVQVTPLGKKKVEYVKTEWVQGQKQLKTLTAEVDDYEFIAFTFRHDGTRVEGSPVTVSMAIQEGWYFRAGSKWPTMTIHQGTLRAISFFGRIRIPEYLKGMKTSEEMHDIIELSQDASGSFSEPVVESKVTQVLDEIKKSKPKKESIVEANVELHTSKPIDITPTVSNNESSLDDGEPF